MENKGFTLIELLIVVAIIGILAAIAVPNFLNAQTRAKIARGQADMRSVATGIETLRLDRGVLLIDHWDDDTTEGRERIRDVFNGVGDLPEGQRGNQHVLAPLTSPISYLSTVPSDGFRRKTEDRTNAQGVYYYLYADNDPKIHSLSTTYDHGLGSFFPDVAPKLGLDVIEEGEFVLVSIGPDGQLGFGGGYGDVGRGVPYDASNGLVSYGDIVLLGGGGRR